MRFVKTLNGGGAAKQRRGERRALFADKCPSCYSKPMRESEWKSRKNVTSLRRNLTKAETKLWRDLRGRGVRGYKFRRQHPIQDYVADFA